MKGRGRVGEEGEGVGRRGRGGGGYMLQDMQGRGSYSYL